MTMVSLMGLIWGYCWGTGRRDEGKPGRSGAVPVCGDSSCAALGLVTVALGERVGFFVECGEDFCGALAGGAVAVGVLEGRWR